MYDLNFILIGIAIFLLILIMYSIHMQNHQKHQKADTLSPSQPVTPNPPNPPNISKEMLIINPEKEAEENRAEWLNSLNRSSVEEYSMNDFSSDSFIGNSSEDRLKSLVITSDQQASHDEFVKAAKPYSRTAMVVDDLNEAIEANSNFIGLFRPKGTPQNNPLFITEVDSNTLQNGGRRIP